MSEARLNDCWNKIGVHGDGSCPELERHVHCRNCPVYSAAAATLLDSAPPAGHLERWTDYFSQPKPAAAAEAGSVVIFRVGAEWLALATAVFREVATLRTIHSLPHRRGGALLGLVNVGGALLVCVSLSHALGLGPPAAGAGEKKGLIHPRLLVVSREGGRIVFPVDEVHGVHRYRAQDMTETPATVAKAATACTRAVLAWRDRAVGCLDDELLFARLNRSLL